jgi:hypothetical protein
LLSYTDEARPSPAADHSKEADMRANPGWVLAAVLPAAAVAPLWADERAAAVAVIESAIKAHGGEEALAKSQTFVRKAAGQLTLSGAVEVAFAEELTAQPPQRWRREVGLRSADQKLRVLVVVNGDKGWESTGGAVAPLTAERLKELREDGYALWLTTLLPLKKDSSLQLAPLPEEKVNGEPALGVKVSSKGHADIKLYFDKKSGLLVKRERPVTEAGESVTEEETYLAHKDFDGVKMPTKVVGTVAGKKRGEITEASYRFPAKIDEATFAKP